MNYLYTAFIHSVYDGDGVYKATVNLGLNIKLQNKKMRLYGVDTPELRGYQREAGKIVAAYVKSKIEGTEVIIKTYKDESGMYGRLLVDIICDDTTLSQILLDKGYGKPYFGKTKDKWTEEELKRIIDGTI